MLSDDPDSKLQDLFFVCFLICRSKVCWDLDMAKIVFFPEIWRIRGPCREMIVDHGTQDPG